MHGAGAGAIPDARLQKIMVAANVTASCSPTLSAYEARIATGALDLVRDDELLYGLADAERMSTEYLDYRAQTTNVWLFTLLPAHRLV